MATNESLKKQLKKRNGNKLVNGNGEPVTLKALLASPAVKKRFEEVLDKRAPQYMTSIVNLYNSDAQLQKCDPMTVISSAMVAASLDLPVDKNLGYAWIIPYGNRAQFQLGYKGYIQLALRTGQYKSINVIEVYEGELQKWDRLTEEFVIDYEKRKSDTVVGYAAYFELINGFKKTVYWTKEEVDRHRKRFSKSDFGWKNDWDAMAKKTVLKNMLSKWGILSIEMQRAFIEDNEEMEQPEPVQLDDEDVNIIDYEEEQQDQDNGDEKEDTKESPEQIAVDFD